MPTRIYLAASEFNADRWPSIERGSSRSKDTHDYERHYANVLARHGYVNLAETYFFFF